MNRPHLSRRAVLTGAAATVIGYNTTTRSWATAESPASGRLVPVPPLQGTLTTNPATRAAFAQDFGRLTTTTPYAVLTPAGAQDIATIINFARRNNLKVAMNGQSGTGTDLESHSNYGQAGVAGGISVNARALNRIHAITPTNATVDAGVTWAQLTEAALAHGLTPPCLTDYLHLSVGGTISVGGIGSTVHKYGLQADTVEAIEIVTGTGRVLTATPTCNADLFHGALAGAGQIGIITRATLKLVPAPENARVFTLFYDDLTTYLTDQQTLLNDGRFPSQVGEVLVQPNGQPPRYKIEAVAHYNGTTPPDPAPLLAGLTPVSAQTTITDTTYRDYTYRVDAFADSIKQLGYWDAPKPWLSLFLPATRTRAFLTETLPQLTPDDIGQGLLLCYPFHTGKLTHPLAVTPAEPVAYLFDLLAFPHPGTDPQPALTRNRRIYDRAVQLGAKRYPVGAIPRMTPADWQTHYGPQWATLTTTKNRYDPTHTLTPGQNIFP
ncbi:FAD-binding protein [Streptomyces sp. NRRL S-350]|uniref:FAD-binding protein n=1 Tax=Streptomyces sp. NRRL S-350 TaxID=1463902 RepID=UPI0004BFFD4E|nr:FAD-binding protein [Streptomyces sp. NRRL S-350]